MDRYKRRENEKFLDYAERLVNGRETGAYDIDKAEIYYLLFGKSINSDEARKRLYFFRDLMEVLNKEEFDEFEDKTALEKALETIGEIDYRTQVLRSQRSSLNRLKKDFTPAMMLAEEMKKHMAENDYQVVIPEYCYEETEREEGNEMIVQISDWHIGYVINGCKGNYFNLEIAKQRIDKFIYEIRKYHHLYGIKHIHVVNTGDMIEQTYMRKNQSQFCEFGLSQQINETKRLIYYFLCALCEFSTVEYDSIAGNHDRMAGDKKEVFKGDHADVIIKDDLIMFNEISGNKKLTIAPLDPFADEIIKEVNGTKHKFIHGHDKKSKNSKDAIKKEMSMDDDFYTLWRGHYHNFNIESENNGRYIVNCGCLSGYNDYSTAFGCTTWASQVIGIIGNGKIELIKDVNLQ